MSFRKGRRGEQEQGEDQGTHFLDVLRPWMEVDSPSVVPVLDVLQITKDILGLVTGFPSGERAFGIDSIPRVPCPRPR